MMKTKHKQETYFHESLIEKWEKNDGVDFSIALARISGWLLQVDWFAASQNDSEHLMTPLRVSIGTDSDDIFDFTGRKNIETYNQNILIPINTKRTKGRPGGILTRFYSEEKLITLPLRVKPDEIEIKKAEEIILKNSRFLDLLPTRLNSRIPAHIAAEYSYGNCVIFAQAKKDKENLPVQAIIVTRYTEQFAYSQLGFCHSIILHSDGEVEDSWGKQPLSKILDRFGILNYILSTEEHDKINENLKRNSPLKYKELYDQISQLI